MVRITFNTVTWYNRPVIIFVNNDTFHMFGGSFLLRENFISMKGCVRAISSCLAAAVQRKAL